MNRQLVSVASSADGSKLVASEVDTTHHFAAAPITLTARLIGAATQVGFTNLTGLQLTVIRSTNASLPVGQWAVPGAPVESPPGTDQFTDSSPTTAPGYFDLVQSP